MSFKKIAQMLYAGHMYVDICFFDDDDNGLVENLLILQDYKVV